MTLSSSLPDRSHCAPAVTILGIGNTLLGDDGVGVHVVRHLQGLAADGKVGLVDGGTLSFNLLPTIEATDRLIVVDAAMIGDEAGTVDCLVGASLDAFLGSAKRTAHEVGLRELFDMARIRDLLPSYRALIGIRPLSMEWSESLSARVASALPFAADLALRLAHEWLDLSNHPR
ncbi:MAG: HyaD/HybD family hydrogenase maturation endopeptidase [Bradyrhizobium sp.]|jgi:hydrogenase maturation protease|uniref:HyaD/HybD family hydrogenase maturation endopeptidase n=1 Tax=Bradyrhizobium sp. TaxID=376 RepID=UPI001A1BE580|nr:HyaD/HybD family hydrogenase maturation endopeptidase [Bradyrhizobium sp.]MBJ7402142.1 HyaD/HybD family hydrogenase maturation endopeptidase [Bradyrhizobium sp.]